MKKRKRKLIWQIVPILLVILIPSFFLCGYFACRAIINLYIENQKEELFGINYYIEQQVISNPNYEWLLGYCSDNAQRIGKEIVYDDRAALEKTRKEFTEKNQGLIYTSVTKEDLSKMDDESRDLYAKICLMELLLEFDDIKETNDLKFIYFVKFLAPDQELFLASGLKEGEKRGYGITDIFYTGNLLDPGLEYHPVLKKTLETKAVVDELEEKEKEGRTGYDFSAFLPIVTDDGSVYIIGSSKRAGTIINQIYNRSKRLIVILVSILLVGTVLMIMAFYNVLLQPLSLVQKRIRIYTENKDAKGLNEALSVIANNNEIGQLSTDVSELAYELERHINEVANLSAKNERIETELTFAREIQKAALPKCKPEFDLYNNFEISAQMNPAKEVSGDFFDYYKIDENHLAIIVADVSGKGIPAAMFMMFSQVCIRNISSIIHDPAEIFEKANNILTERNEMEMFVTAWFGILDLRTGQIECVNAGHENPAIYRDGQGFSLYKSKHGFVLAGMEGSRYNTETLQLNSGDILFLYTDGVAEATNKNDELYGTEKMVNALNSVKDLDCDKILDTVKEDINSFVGDAPQFDDLTMLCLKIK